MMAAVPYSTRIVDLVDRNWDMNLSLPLCLMGIQACFRNWTKQLLAGMMSGHTDLYLVPYLTVAETPAGTFQYAIHHMHLLLDLQPGPCKILRKIQFGPWQEQGRVLVGSLESMIQNGSYS
jgi:hypothetical protein